MQNEMTKHWPLMLIAAAMGFSFYAVTKVFKAPVVALVTGNLSYEMPRANQDGVPFDLSGRSVNRRIRISSPAQSLTQRTPISLKMNPAKAKQVTVLSKAQLLEKKRTEDKKKALVAAAAKAKAAKAKLAVRVVEAGTRQGRQIETSPMAMAQNSNPSDYTATPTLAALPAAAPAQTHETPEKTKLSAGQWRSLLASQPSARNGSDFLSAFHAGDLDASDFYQITDELLSDSAPDREKLAIFILKQEDSAKTFSILVSHDQEKNPEPVKSQIKALIQSYTEASRFSALAKTLYSTDIQVVHRASELMAQVVAAEKVNTTSNRTNRSPGSAPVSIAQLQTALPALSRLLKSDDQVLVQQAQALIESILALKPVQTA